MIEQAKASRVGDDLVEASEEMAAYIRGEVDAESYEVADDELTLIVSRITGRQPPHNGQ